MQLGGILMLMAGLVGLAAATEGAVVVALLVGGMVVVLMGVMVVAMTVNTVTTAAAAAAAAGLEAQVLMLPVMKAVLEAPLQLLLPEVRLVFLAIHMLFLLSGILEKKAKTVLIIAQLE